MEVNVECIIPNIHIFESKSLSFPLYIVCVYSLIKHENRFFSMLFFLEKKFSLYTHFPSSSFYRSFAKLRSLEPGVNFHSQLNWHKNNIVSDGSYVELNYRELKNNKNVYQQSYCSIIHRLKKVWKFKERQRNFLRKDTQRELRLNF